MCGQLVYNPFVKENVCSFLNDEKEKVPCKLINFYELSKTKCCQHLCLQKAFLQAITLLSKFGLKAPNTGLAHHCFCENRGWHEKPSSRSLTRRGFLRRKPIGAFYRGRDAQSQLHSWFFLALLTPRSRLDLAAQRMNRNISTNLGG